MPLSQSGALALDHARLEIDQAELHLQQPHAPGNDQRLGDAFPRFLAARAHRANRPPRSGRTSCRKLRSSGTASGPPLDETLRW